MKTLALFIGVLLWIPLAADPWGKDADLCRQPKALSASPPCRTPLFGAVAEALIQFHQDVISPCDGPRSHFLPSSSQYTLEAMRKYGFYQGFTMGCDRLMRENNEAWVYPTTIDASGKKMKLDPVP
jgi:putative component of membrane protein insertase Oxa1/YidC/SpoIIIJ protein YidD